MNEKIQKVAKLFEKKAKEYWGRKASGFLFVCKDDNTVFLALRSPSTGGGWSAVGGAVAQAGEGWFDSDHDTPDPPDQIFWNSAVREVIEELGSMPNVQSTLADTLFRDGGFTYKTFICNLTREEKDRWTNGLKIKPSEHSSARWFPVNDLPSNRHPGLAYSLQNIRT